MPHNNRFHTETFFCTVEGQTEKKYLEWLQKTINPEHGRSCNIKIYASVSHPAAFVKSIKIIDRTDVYHVIDTEQLTGQSIQAFHTKIDEMRKAEKLGKEITYRLAYSNMSFEAWILLHKTHTVPYVPNPPSYLALINKCFKTRFQSIKEFKEETNLDRVLSLLNLQDVRNAVENATSLMKNVSQNKTPTLYRKERYYCDNPSLSVHEFVKRILCAAGL